MKTDGMSDSEENVEDRRGQRGGRIPAGGAMKMGIPAVIVAILAIVFGGQLTGGGGDGSGVNLPDIFNQLQPAPSATGGSGVPGAPDAQAEARTFTIKVFNDVQAFWTETFARSGSEYREATLVLFSGGTTSECGAASSATGPFYCPADEKVYIDLEFFDELAVRFDAPGDFAQAYVIAHEVGHHVQAVTGIEPDVRRQQEKGPKSANDLSVRLELQADCFAGVWAFTVYGREFAESGDLEEAIGAASAVGDDRLQKQSTGRVNPDTFTHGTSEQRTKWFRRGFDSGEPDRCDTFSGGL